MVEEIEANGGAMNCVVSGYQQRQIHETAWNQLKSIEDGTTSVIGVNKFSEEDHSTLMGQIQDQDNAEFQSKMVHQIIQNREKTKAEKCILEIEKAAINGTNLMEPLIDAFKAEVTLGEVNEVLRQNFGTWVAPSGV